LETKERVQEGGGGGGGGGEWQAARYIKLANQGGTAVAKMRQPGLFLIFAATCVFGNINYNGS
jgi:hypothetical protein